MTATAALPPFAAAAVISVGLSVSLWFTGNEQEAIFVGIWVPSILALGSLAMPRAAT